MMLSKRNKRKQKITKEKNQKKVINLLKSLIKDKKIKSEIKKEITEINLKKTINI